ncbi:MAG: Asp-tRNA(Asn)/Glu-tRNA(Gln) amidotransferase subunit GatC [Anaerolineae bacterium]|nr:Asp-tRNA(Asn)/Glu-tRNA(Gln) amidotransferase subunit GatC [Anaerolineae bacterium]
MILSREDVEHVAELAKLALTDAEQEMYQAQLSAILEHFATLAHLDTDDIPGTASALALKNVLREDEVQPSLPRAAALANAPRTEAGQFRVEAVLD